MKIDPLKILFLILFIFGMYLLINRMLGHSAALETIVAILTGGMLTAILDLYRSHGLIYKEIGKTNERIAKIEKDIEQIKNVVIK